MNGTRSAAAEAVIREVADFPDIVSELRAAPAASVGEIRSFLQGAFPFREPVPLDVLVEAVAHMMRKWTLHTTHPRYFGLFNPAVHEAGVWADTLAALYNPQLGAWRHAPAACEMERHVLNYFASHLGWAGDGVAAHFTTGGSEANQTAVLAALSSRIKEWRERGANNGINPSLYVSTEAHHSFIKIARASGIGENGIRTVAVDEDGRMNAESLSGMIAADRTGGARVPFMIVATAGTTAGGAIDPLRSINHIARTNDLWLHVDAAWGGGALFSESLRHHIDGIQHADSVTWDAHKWMSVPMGAGMFFCRHPRVLNDIFGVHTSYVPPELPGEEDAYRNTIQWSRRFIGLKVFMTMAALGGAGMSEIIERHVHHAALLRARLGERGWLIRNNSPLPVVCFTHPVIEQNVISAANVADGVCASGRAWLSTTRLGGGQPMLRACITNYQTSESDIDILVETLSQVLEQTLAA